MREVSAPGVLMNLRFRYLPVGVLALTSTVVSSPVFGSTIYLSDTDELKIANDDDPTTYVSTTKDDKCKLALFEENSNINPYGDNRLAPSAKWPLSDSDWNIHLPVVTRLRRWKTLSTTPIIDFIREAIDSFIEEGNKKEALCFSQAKTLRTTDQGRLCLSDFEYAQLEQQKRQPEPSSLQNFAPISIDGCPPGKSRYQTRGLFGLFKKDLGCMTDYEANSYNQQNLQNTLNNINNNRQRHCVTNMIGTQAFTSCY